ncbi:MAG: EamA family transporter [Nocardioides sp.]|nr:EamA family transporter [Nocardioides sp.]
MTVPRAPGLPPVWLVLIGIVCVQLGAGFAKNLFDDAAPVTVVWLRLTASALVLLVVVRPVLVGHSRTDWAVMAGYGVSLVTMNWAIYESFARLPLGVAVTIEFVGPLSIALLGSRRLRDLVWAGLAATGVVLLGATPGDLDLVGVLLALLAGAAWAAYILLSAQTGRRWSGLSGLATASVVAALLVTPIVLSRHAGEITQPQVVVIGALVGLLSSVIPYTCELVALRSLSTSVFGILMSLEPAAAALAGLVVVREVLSPVQVVAMACVVLASIGATRSGASVVEFTQQSSDGDLDEPVAR